MKRGHDAREGLAAVASGGVSQGGEALFRESGSGGAAESLPPVIAPRYRRRRAHPQPRRELVQLRGRADELQDVFDLRANLGHDPA